MVLFVVLLEILKAHLKSARKLDSNFLLLLEYELIILHIFFSVCFKVRSDLMQIETVFIRALLAIHKELTKL